MAPRPPTTPPKKDRPKSISSTSSSTQLPSHHVRNQSQTSKPPNLLPHPATPATTFNPSTTPHFQRHQHDVNTDTNINANFDPDSPLHFSPSKARAAAQASHQLSLLTHWLDEILSFSSSSSSSSSSPSLASLSLSAAAAAAPNDISLPLQQQLQQRQLLSKWTTEYRSLTTTNPDVAAEMMQWLQEVMVQNRTADERRRLIFEAMGEQLASAEDRNPQRPSSPGSLRSSPSSSSPSPSADVVDDDRAKANETIQTVYRTLSDEAKKAIDSIAETSVLLGGRGIITNQSSATLLTELGQMVMEHTLRAQDLQNHMDSLRGVQRELTKRLEESRREYEEEFEEGEKKAARRDAEIMRPQTAQWNRETKQISLKIQEYRDRLAVLQRSQPGRGGGGADDFVRIEDVLELQERVRKKSERTRLLEDKIRTAHGLPPDLEASRSELKRATAELERLKVRREELFSMISGK